MARHPDIQYIRFRTEGSTARKVEVAEPIKTMRLPRAKKQKRITLRIDPLAVTAILLTVCMAVLMVIGAVRLDAAQQETIAMQAYVEKLEARGEELDTKFQENFQEDELERTAMALGLVPKSEVKHITVQLPPEIAEEEPGVWDRFTTFLTGLFA